MENIWRRLRYYGIGFGLGLVFVFFFFQNRGCSWLPSNRVKNAILDRVLVISDDTQVKLDKKKITDDAIIQVLNDGEVNFKQSDKDGDSKVYALEKDGVTYFFTLPFESFISEVRMERTTTSENLFSTKGEGRLLHFPADENLVFPDSTQIVTCQQELLKLSDPRKILKSLKSGGKIDFSQSRLALKPKPEHYLKFNYNNKLVGATVIWYKNKLNISSFHFEGDTLCK